MNVGLLLITHAQLGEDLVGVASAMFGGFPLPVRCIAVERGDDPDAVVARAEALIPELDSGAGVLVLTDMFGSTPSNIASRLCSGGRVMMLTGVNLPMLIRVCNYAELDLATLVDKALSGGRDGIFRARPEVD